MSDFIDKKIFVKNYNDTLKSGDLIKELEAVTSAIKRSCGDDMKYPSIYNAMIQRLKQVVWILEANNHRYE